MLISLIDAITKTRSECQPANRSDVCSQCSANTDSSLDDWWALNREEVEKVFSNFNLESEENLTLTKDNLYAKRFVYTADLGGYSYRYMQVAAVKGTSVYLFTYASVPENYEKHLDAVDEMLGFLIIK